MSEIDDRLDGLEAQLVDQQETIENQQAVIAEQRERIVDLEAENEDLRAENEQLRERMAAIEAELGLDATADRQGVADD